MKTSVSFSHLVDFSFQITKEKKKILKEGGRGGEGVHHFLNNNFKKILYT
jgi:hypothetical protein